MVNVGDMVETRGGWEAQIVWVTCLGEIYAVHRPGEAEFESCPILHDPAGRALPQFSVCGAPVYDVGHPADLLL